MAKKSRRTRSTPRLSAAQLVGASERALPAAGATRRTVADAPRSSLAREDYSHVREDLKRIAVLAASFITIMVLLSFILPQFIR